MKQRAPLIRVRPARYRLGMMLRAWLFPLLIAGLVQGVGVTLTYATRLVLVSGDPGYWPTGLAMARIFIPVGLGTWLVVGVLGFVLSRHLIRSMPENTRWIVMGVAALLAALAFHPEILGSPMRTLSSALVTALAGYAGYRVAARR